MKRAYLAALILATLAYIGIARALAPSLCAVSGQVINPDGTGCANCVITFSPNGNQPQIVNGVPGNAVSPSAPPGVVYTTTDGNGNIVAISLVQGTAMVVTITNANGGVSGPIQVAVPYTNGVDFAQLLAQNALQQYTSTVNGLSVGTSTILGPAIYAVLPTDFFVYCDATAGAVTINLPASSGGGRWLHFEKVDTSANTCTVVPAGTDTIDGVEAPTGDVTLSSQYAGIYLNDGILGAWFSSNNEQASPTATATPVPGSTPVPVSCSGSSISCVGNGTNTLNCSSAGVGDFTQGEGVYVANGSTTACTINGGPCPTPVAPTMAVVMSSRLQACTDVTVTTTTGHAQYVSAGQCNFSFLQPGDFIRVGGASIAGDNGSFTVLTATPTTLRFTAASVPGEGPGSSFDFQTQVPIGGGTIAIGNMNDDVGVVLDPEQRPFNQVTEAPSYGTYNLSVTSNIGTYTFGQPDEGKPVTIYYQTHTAPAGTTNYCANTFLRDGIQDGYSPPSATQGCVTTATLSFPNFLHGMPFLEMLPGAAVAGAEAYDFWETDNGGTPYWSTRLWPNTAYVALQVTLPTTATCTSGGESNCIQTGSTLGFPMNNTLNIGGQSVTCTGVKADAFFNCTGGTGTMTLGTPIISTLMPRPHVAYGGGLQYGQDPWSSEAWPQGATMPTTQGNDDFTPTAPPTITSITGSNLTLSAPVATGTWTVQHTEQNILNTALLQLPTSGGVLTIPQGSTAAGCITRFCQMPFNPNQAAAFGVVTIAGMAGQLGGSELRSYCDGGGLNAINGLMQPGNGVLNGLTVGAVGNPAHLDMRDLALTSTNSALSVLLNASSQNFDETRLRNVSLAAHSFVNMGTGHTSRTGASHTTGINVRLGTLTAQNIVTRYVDSPVWINGGVNGWWIQGTGSFNQSSSAGLWHPMLGYAGASFNGNFGAAVIDEIPWTAIRPLDGNPGNSLQDFTMTNNYLGDIEDWGPSAPVRGAVVDYGGSSGVFIGGFFGQNQPGLGGIYINGSSQGNHANLIENNIAAGTFGVLVDNAGTATMTGVNITNLQNNKTGIECRGNCSVRNPQETITFGATGAIGFKAGYKGDESTCNTTSATDFSYHNAELTFLANDVSICPTAASAIITNDLGTQVLQGVPPTVTSCGTSPVQPAFPSGNLGLTWTMGTGSPTACTVTFATAAQGTASQPPLCLFQDVTHPAITVTDAPTAPPTATDVLTFSGSATSDVIKGQCRWSN